LSKEHIYEKVLCTLFEGSRIQPALFTLVQDQRLMTSKSFRTLRFLIFQCDMLGQVLQFFV